MNYSFYQMRQMQEKGWQEFKTQKKINEASNQTLEADVREMS